MKIFTIHQENYMDHATLHHCHQNGKHVVTGGADWTKQNAMGIHTLKDVLDRACQVAENGDMIVFANYSAQELEQFDMEPGQTAFNLVKRLEAVPLGGN